MQDSRLLSMLLIISDKKMVTAKDLANHFEVSIRTIYRDIEKLCISGVPIASIGGKGGGYYLMENYNIENLFLNKNEANTFLSVVNSLDFIFGKNKQFNNILLKIKNTYKDEIFNENNKLKINLSHFSMEQELKEYLLFIDEQIESNHLIIFDYINRRLEYECRTVEPIQLSFSSGQWFLVAYCLNRNDYRKFKLTRMRNLCVGSIFEKKEISNAQLEEIFSSGFKQRSIEVILKFPKKTGFHLTEHFTKEEISINQDEDYIIKAYFPYDEGLIRFILTFGNSCEVLQPLELRKDLQKYLLEMAIKYND